MKKQLKSAVIALGGFVILLFVIGIAAGCGKITPTANISPTSTATPTPTASPSHTPKVVAKKAKKHPARKHTAVATPAAPPSTPVQTTPSVTSAPPAPATPTGCHPLTNGGNCYEPGEYCRNSDHGVSGVAGDGEAIICEDNNGWRWEPA